MNRIFPRCPQCQGKGCTDVACRFSGIRHTKATGMKSTPEQLEYYREYRRLNAERIKVVDRERRRRPEYRERNNARNRATPKTRAWLIVRNRITKGTLRRQPCVFCGKPNGHAHHEDYSKPYEIVWICQAHHSMIHAGLLKVRPEQIVTIPKRIKPRFRMKGTVDMGYECAMPHLQA